MKIDPPNNLLPRTRRLLTSAYTANASKTALPWPSVISLKQRLLAKGAGIRALSFALFFVFIECAVAETHQYYEFRSQISITKLDIIDRWDLNLFTSENANLSSKNHDGVEPPVNIQNYFLAAPTYKFSSNLHVVFLGYIYQKTHPTFDNFINENRLFQQVVYSQNTNQGLLTHRLRFEQRFIHDVAPEQKFFGTRLRYQIGFLIPLQGKELNNGEFYLNIYNEFYFTLTGVKATVYNENWTYAGIGYQSKKYGRFEIGPLLQRVIVEKQHDVRHFNLLQLSWSYNF